MKTLETSILTCPVITDNLMKHYFCHCVLVPKTAKEKNISTKSLSEAQSEHPIITAWLEFGQNHK